MRHSFLAWGIFLTTRFPFGVKLIIKRNSFLIIWWRKNKLGPLVLKKTFADCSFIYYCYIPYNIPQPRHYQLVDVLSKWVCWVGCYFLFTFHSFFMNIEKNLCKCFEIISEFSKSFIFSLCSGLGWIIWDKVLKNGPSNICGRQPFKNLKGYGVLHILLQHCYETLT